MLIRGVSTVGFSQNHLKKCINCCETDRFIMQVITDNFIMLVEGLAADKLGRLRVANNSTEIRLQSIVSLSIMVKQRVTSGLHFGQ